jgi:hypothetical protein
MGGEPCGGAVREVGEETVDFGVGEEEGVEVVEGADGWGETVGADGVGVDGEACGVSVVDERGDFAVIW